MEKIVGSLLFIIIAMSVFITGCVDDTLEEGSPFISEGTMALYISDKPADIEDFDLLNVSFNKVRIFKENENETDENWTEMSINETVDLTMLVGPNSTRIVNITLEAGNYTKLELYVNHTLGIVDGNETDVFVPSGKLMITKKFTISANDTLRFVFDINVVKRGNNNKYNLLPVISESGVVGRDLDEEDFVEI